MGRQLSPESRYYRWLLLPAGVVALVLAFVLVRAEEHEHYSAAQACLVTIMLLFVLVAWGWWETNHEPPQLRAEAATYYAAMRLLLLCVGIGLAALVLGATRWDFWKYGVVAKVIGYVTVEAGAFFVLGMLFGYLFGLRPTGVPQTSSDPSSSTRPQPITNLEEIADWFTKLILGAGLVELTKLPGPIFKLARFMASGVYQPPQQQQASGLGSPAIAFAIMVFFSASGILYGYLWTRYEHAVAAEPYTDASALALLTRWLNAPSTPDDQTRANMMNAIKGASLAAKLRIFLQAEQYRRPSTEDANDRSLPIFQSLVEADLQEIFHRNRSQYALALMGRKKGPKNPDDDWKRALDLLNIAIRIRDGSGEKDWHDYELARAVCQIHLDPEFKTKQSSTAEQKQCILADLETAKDVSEATSKEIDSDHVIGDWKSLNGI